jgi:hypothetical protein
MDLLFRISLHSTSTLNNTACRQYHHMEVHFEQSSVTEKELVNMVRTDGG